MRLFAILRHLHKESTQLKRIRDAIMLHSNFLLTHITCGIGSVLIDKSWPVSLSLSPHAPSFERVRVCDGLSPLIP